MDDLIRRRDAIDAIFSEPLYETGMKERGAGEVIPAILEKIKALPTANPKVLAYGSGILVENTDPDVVRIVRCKDCAWWQREWPDAGNGRHYCTMTDDHTDADFYCANAERRE